MKRASWTVVLFFLLAVLGPVSADEEPADEKRADGADAPETAPDASAEAAKGGPAAEEPDEQSPDAPPEEPPEDPVEDPAPTRPPLFERAASLPGHTGLVRALAFDGAGRTLATSGADRSLRLWDVRTARERSSVVVPRCGRGP